MQRREASSNGRQQPMLQHLQRVLSDTPADIRARSPIRGQRATCM
jgi:hypothetical protein